MTCALHCLLTPLLVASVSLGAINWLASEGTELAMLSLATTLAAVVLVWGWHVHRRLGSLGLFAVALVLIVAGRFLAPETVETPMVVAGSLSIALAHAVNARLCRLCAGCRAAAEATALTDRPPQERLTLVLRTRPPRPNPLPGGARGTDRVPFSPRGEGARRADEGDSSSD